MVDVQTIGVLVTAVSVSLAAIYYMFTLRISQRNMKMNLETRQAQLLMSLLNRFTESEYNKKWQTTLWNMSWVDYDDKMRKYPWGSPEFIDEGTLWNYFESVAVLFEEGLIDLRIISKLISADLIQFWEKFGPPLIEMRRRRGMPLFDHTEHLYDELKRVASPDIMYRPNRPF
jgi:hypothetical protein